MIILFFIFCILGLGVLFGFLFLSFGVPIFIFNHLIINEKLKLMNQSIYLIYALSLIICALFWLIPIGFNMFSASGVFNYLVMIPFTTLIPGLVIKFIELYFIWTGKELTNDLSITKFIKKNKSATKN